MNKTGLTVLLFLLTAFYSFGKTTTEITVPAFNDKYSEFVKELEAGHTGINYREFRESFIESKQFIVASKSRKEFNDLKKEMYVQMNKSNYQEVIKITKAMLSIDYTSMLAHKILRQTYKITGDTLNANKHKTIQFGLLYSIVKSGDGKTCETAWPVIQLDEEYFLLQMLDVSLLEQIIDNTGGLCDKMDVKTKDGLKETFYFETSQVFKGYKKLGMK